MSGLLQSFEGLNDPRFPTPRSLLSALRSLLCALHSSPASYPAPRRAQSMLPSSSAGAADMDRHPGADDLRAMAMEAGFDLAAVAPAGPSPRAAALRAWLAAGNQAGMTWMARTADRRIDPRVAWPGTGSFLVAGLSYFTAEPPPDLWNDPARGRVSRYAWGPDYHEVLGARLRGLAERIRRLAGLAQPPRVFVDTAAVLERDLAERAGLGFIGRNAQWIAPGLGSYAHIGGLALPWAADAAPPPPPAGTGCGRCRRCRDACPTGALAADRLVDARRCLSWLTLECRGPIPKDLQPRMGRWIAGCDACQEPCPWVRAKSRPAGASYLRFDADLHAPRLDAVLALDDAGFRERYHGTVLARTGLDRLRRNAAIAMANGRADRG